LNQLKRFDRAAEKQKNSFDTAGYKDVTPYGVFLVRQSNFCSFAIRPITAKQCGNAQP